MTIRHDRLAAALGLMAAAFSVPARAGDAFDGAWTVTQSCPPTGQDVRGYAWSFPATLRGGVLSGAHVATSDGGGSLRLHGRIGADGAALLDASGTVGHADYAVGHVAHGTPVHFHVRAQFTAGAGSGSRVETRPCEFAFARN